MSKKHKWTYTELWNWLQEQKSYKDWAKSCDDVRDAKAKCTKTLIDILAKHGK